MMGTFNKPFKKTEYKYEIFRKMEFNSDRKRMTVLLRDPNDGLIKMLIKGADSIILDRIDKKALTEQMKSELDWFLNTASTQGLRTLLMGVRVVEESEKDAFLAECAEAEKDLKNREMLLDEIYDRFERGVVLLGSTAVEDRLQD